ncbi:MAG: hypothetical protein AAGI01_04220 [Myxococcota bacterium]
MDHIFTRIAVSSFLASLTLVPIDALAQPAPEKGDFVDEEVLKTKDAVDKRPEGWDATLSVGASVNFVNNSNFAGQIEGSTWTLGANLAGGLDYIGGNNDLRTTLTINETFTNTPALPIFVSTADEIRLEALYYYTIPQVKWLGPFARAEARSSLFPGVDARAGAPEDLTWVSTDDLDPDNDPATPPPGLETNSIEDAEGDAVGESFRLRDPLQPMFLKQSVGAFARPLSRRRLELEIRLGAGAQQVFANGQFALNDNADTPEIEVQPLQNYQQLGAETAIKASGALAEKRVTYSVLFETLTPFIQSTDDERGAIDLTALELTTKISFKLVEWASLDYQLRVLRQPLLVDGPQVQNNLLLTFGYTLIEAKPVAEASE